MADLPSFNEQTYREIDRAVTEYWRNRPRGQAVEANDE